MTLLMTFKMCKILLKSPQFMVLCRCGIKRLLDVLGFGLEFIIGFGFGSKSLSLSSNTKSLITSLVTS